ncbi:ribbon-helix-helix domain-containing protein [Nesterenkonia aerolata]|uniref:CopG family transcriptional regulator n=1 Tax=Nesterenkonia aerolata TaxID=3074079 RepID=A0ABU2DV25_9MICC|nr:CopG family transcriptional regulator [Nesterenkonia sp. LY-0111]MDR8020352.1 CopG family transcriptional regulator [Nesterenkonia sp. LY-0111]
MGKYTAVDGTAFTDEDIERWAAEAESEQGYTGGHIGPSVPGRPVSVGAEAKPFTLRLDANRRAKLNQLAKERHTTPSELMRALIDAL